MKCAFCIQLFRGAKHSYLHKTLHTCIWVNHAGFIYVDDWLWLLPVSVGPVLAAYIIIVLCI